MIKNIWINIPGFFRRSPKLHHREAHLHSKPYGLPEQHSTLLCSPKEEIRENNRKS